MNFSGHKNVFHLYKELTQLYNGQMPSCQTKTWFLDYKKINVLVVGVVRHYDIFAISANTLQVMHID